MQEIPIDPFRHALRGERLSPCQLPWVPRRKKPFWTDILPIPGRATAMKLSYVIKFVADMDRAVKFYRDVLGLPLKFLPGRVLLKSNG